MEPKIRSVVATTEDLKWIPFEDPEFLEIQGSSNPGRKSKAQTTTASPHGNYP